MQSGAEPNQFAKLIRAVSLYSSAAQNTATTNLTPSTSPIKLNMTATNFQFVRLFLGVAIANRIELVADSGNPSRSRVGPTGVSQWPQQNDIASTKPVSIDASPA